MSDLVSLLDLTDLAIARSLDVLDDASRGRIAATAKRLRSRAGYVGDALLVALAGGTGSGKSSLLNALVSEVVVEVGAVRPTTAVATAVVPSSIQANLGGLMASLNVESVVESATLSATVLVDLPDFDSIERAHRHIVESVLPNVDAVLWVFDPEKYADPVVHDTFLSRLTAYEDQFIFVLNQTDRLGEDAHVVAQDLGRRLVDNGYVSPEIVCCVASGAIDVVELESVISKRFNVKSTALAKAAVDLQVAANTAWKTCRDRGATDLDSDDAYDGALAEATFVSLGVAAYEFRHSIERS